MSPLESMVAGKQVVGVAGGVVRNCDIAINRNFAWATAKHWCDL